AMQDPSHLLASGPAQLRRALWLTRLGMLAERSIRAFWPFLTIALAAISALMFGLQDALPLGAVWALAALVGAGLLGSLTYGVWRLRLPTQAEAQARVDATLPGRPLQALTDRQAIGTGDLASEAVWRVHLARMA